MAHQLNSCRDSLEDEMRYLEVLQSMIDYLKEVPDCGYNAKHIDKCDKILDDYVNSLLALKNNADDSKIKKCVERIVVALNELNEQTDYSLIETDQREDLCDFIQTKAIEAGLTETDEDVTLEWREF